MTILDNTLLYLLAKSDGETSEEKIANFTFLSFLLGTFSLFFSFLTFLYGVVTNDFLKQGRVFQLFIIFFALGISLTILSI